MAALVSVSVDLDAMACYHRIHALSAPVPGSAQFAVLRACLPRFAELFAKHNVKATFFVVGQDLADDAEGKALLSALAAQGHELASHSHTHPYDLVRLPRAQIALELKQAHAAIATTAGTPPVGFRAPGYEVSATIIEELQALGYVYDSSVFPSVPYYAAKAVVMGAMRMLGRTSGSILGSPKVLLAPTKPYRPHRLDPYARGDAALLELPVTVTPGLRIPVIGTLVATAPVALRRLLISSALGTPHFNFELHGIDLCDAVGDQVAPELLAKQPDLRVPLSRKLQALDDTLAQCHAAQAQFVTLKQAAAMF